MARKRPTAEQRAEWLSQSLQRFTRETAFLLSYSLLQKAKSDPEVTDERLAELQREHDNEKALWAEFCERTGKDPCDPWRRQVLCDTPPYPEPERIRKKRSRKS